MKNLLATLLLLFIVYQLNAQSNQKAFFGIGAGLDYGGLGIRAEAQPVPSVGIFCGVGYNLLNPAFNAGASYKFLTNKRVQPILLAMYGYNGVIKVQSRYPYKTYYGFSIGTGVEIYNKEKKNKLALEVLLPFRPEFDKHLQDLKDGGYTFPGVTKVTFTIGYNFYIAKNKKD